MGCTADMDRIPWIDCVGFEMLLHAGPHETLALLVLARIGLVTAEPAEQAAHKEHHLPIRMIIPGDDGSFDILVPPFGIVLNPRVPEQEGVEDINGWLDRPHLYAQSRTMKARLLFDILWLLAKLRLQGFILLRHPLEHMVDAPIDEDQFRLGMGQRIGDGLKLCGELRDGTH